MARIPDASALGGRTAPVSRRQLVVDQSGEIEAAGLGRAAQDVGQAVQVFTERRDKLRYAEAKSALLSADIAARKTLENDQDWETHETRYSEMMAKAREKASGLIRDKSDRALFDMDANLDVERGLGSVRDGARRIEVDTGRATLGSVLAANRTAALEAGDEATRSAIIQANQDAIAGARDKGYLTAQEAMKSGQDWTADYAEAFVGMKEPAERVALLAQPGVADFIAPDRRVDLTRSAEREIEAARRAAEAERKAGLVEARQAMDDRLRDISVAAQMGLPIEVPDSATLKVLYGYREGTQRYQAARKYADLSAQTAKLHGLSADELMQEAVSTRPTKVEGAADQAQLAGFVEKSVRQVLDAREKDPAGYLIQYSPAVQKAWQGFQENPGAYLSAVRAEKERLGILNDATLPDRYVQSVADDISTSATAEKLAGRIEEEAQRWGDAWPDVYAQLAGKLPDIAMVIGSGIPKAAASALASTMGLKNTELAGMLPASTKLADVQTAVEEQFSDFTKSMPMEATQTVNAVQDSAVRLSIKYMNDGDSRKDAVRKAYRDLVESQYNMADFRGKTLRVPLEIDSGEVERGAEAVLNEYTLSPGAFVMPQNSLIPEEEYASQWTAYVKDNGYWLTRPDAKGLRLYVDGAPVTSKAGPVDVSWEDVSQKGREFTFTRAGKAEKR